MENKVCSYCKTEKSFSDFHKNRAQKDGYKNQCKLCIKTTKNINTIKLYNQKYFKLNKDKILSKNKIYYNQNKEQILTQNKKWRDENLDLEIERNRLREYRLKNNEKVSEDQKIWRENNKKHTLDYAKKYRAENKDKINNNFSIKYHNDPLFKLSVNIRNAIRKPLKENGYLKKSKTIEILGCSFEEFKLHLESKFEPWMTWENHGLYNGGPNHGWDIDHHLPISSAKSEEDVVRLNHYTNLQPLCSYINRVVKKDKR